MEKQINIGVTCIGSVIGQGVVKSIKNSSLKSNITITGFDYFPDVAGSQWVDSFHIMPDILNSDVSENEYLDLLIQKIKTDDLRILFVGIGFELSMMARNRDRILSETGCDVIVSNPEQIAMAMDKYKTFEFLRENNLAFPNTWLPNEIDDVVFPAVVKPRRGTGSKGVSVVNDHTELIKALEGLNDPMIQENIGTKDDEYTCGVIFLDGELKSSICLRRYLKSGNTDVAMHSNDIPEEINNYVRKLAKTYKPYGPANFQLRMGGDGIPKLFEINPRFSGTTGMRPLFGVNEVEIVIRHTQKLSPRPMQKKYGKIVRYLEEIFIEHSSESL